ncbi:unnamed protein product [Cyclocybe aegerita]|uniref:Uncharacterized protein n=1 Tax=Cyclocybe aegerita TaxID=1973307 RepID=A0A8S0WMN1_CYCAE|nr:unnamed protein product [Cyclocybe aegerita]
MVDLPFDIIELIIDALAAQNDKETLRNFATVSSTFVVRCQKHLFRTVNLGERCIPGKEFYRRFFRLISQRRKFCTYVEDLRLVDTYIWDKEKDKNWGWLTEEESICDLLDLLPNLRAFSLTFNIGHPTWVSLRQCIRHALMQVAKRPAVESFTLARIKDFPPSLLVSLATVKHLRLDDVHVHAAYLTHSLGVALEFATLSPTIETLVLKAPSAATLHVLHNVLMLHRTPTLKTLWLAVLDQQDAQLMTELWTLMQWAAESLTCLEWRPATRTQDSVLRPPRPIDFSVLKFLQTFHFLVNFHAKPALSSPPRSHYLFSDLISILRELGTPSAAHFSPSTYQHSLTNLVIECMFLNAVELVGCASDWSSLDATLCSEPFSNLRRVVFRAGQKVAPSLRTAAKMILMEQLPVARGRGVRIVYYENLS